MKQVKVLVLTLIVLMGIGFTSCMNSDDNYTPIWQGPVEVISSVYGGTYFKIGELKIQPTTTSLMAVEETYKFDPSSTKMAYIACTYSNDEASGNSGATNTLKNVTLNYALLPRVKKISIFWIIVIFLLEYHIMFRKSSIRLHW